MPPKRPVSAKNYFSEPQKKWKMMTIREKVKLVSGLNKTENVFNLSCFFPSIFREVSFHEYWPQMRREF